MAKDLDPKCKQCRREGEKLFLKGERCYSVKCAIVKRNYIPGAHGNKKIPRLTEYGTQLRTKQRAKRMYRMRETQFYNTYAKAIKTPGNSGQNLLLLLELRLDNVIYRSGLAESRLQARQLVNHGHFKINTHQVNIPSYQVKIGDVIQVDVTKDKKIFWEKFKKAQKQVTVSEIPSWLTVDRSTLEVKIASKPELEKLAEGMNAQIIIEYYSH